MPVSHIALTVTHLPTSVSFYLSALQPLNYVFLGQWGSSVGLGPSAGPDISSEPDLFITQESPSSGLRAGTSHIAFIAHSRGAVRACYAAALKAGACPGEEPAWRDGGVGDVQCFNAVMLDPDGNGVEVVFHDDLPARRRSEAGGRRELIEWRDEDERVERGSRALSRVERESKSLEKWKGIGTAALDALTLTPADRGLRPSTTRRSSASAAPTPSSRRDSDGLIPGLVRSFTDPLLREAKKIEMSDKAVIGTVLGAAAGAAVAYAMCKAEDESAREEWEFNRRMREKRESRPPHRIEMIDYEPRDRDREGERRRRSLLAIEAPPPAPRTLLPDRPYDPPSYESVIKESATRPKRNEERARVDKSLAMSWTWPAELAPDNRYNDRPREGKSRSGGSRIARSRRNSELDRPGKPPSALPAPEPKRHQIEGLEDSKTVLPSDSVSCAGSRSRRSHSRSVSKMGKRRGERLNRIDESRRWALPLRAREW